MDKKQAHYPLKQIKEAVSSRGLSAFTLTAQNGIAAMNLSPDEAMHVVLGLQRSMLYKSMTTYANHQVWQDVYHAPCPNGKTAYIKVTLQDGAVVIQFKEK